MFLLLCAYTAWSQAFPPVCGPEEKHCAEFYTPEFAAIEVGVNAIVSLLLAGLTWAVAAVVAWIRRRRVVTTAL